MKKGRGGKKQVKNGKSQAKNEDENNIPNGDSVGFRSRLGAWLVGWLVVKLLTKKRKKKKEKEKINKEYF